MRAIWNKLNKDPYTYVKNLKRDKLEDIIRLANEDYYNDESKLSDEIYDMIKNILEYKYPNSEVLTNVGAEVTSEKVTLPVYMGSMDKLKPDTRSLDNWFAKYAGPYITSHKLDGISLLLDHNHSPPKAYTRGNGKEGQDISWIIKYIKVGKLNSGIVRGELIVSKKNWEKIKHISQNPRNFVSGYVSRKKISSEWMKYIDFVAYEYIHKTDKKSIGDQLVFLTQKGFNVVDFSKHTTINSKILSDMLLKSRKNSTYEIDGIIISDDEVHPRVNGKNPDHAKAFKMILDDQRAESTVLTINWKPSMYGILKPVVQVEPVHLNGVTIQNISAYNARFIKKNKIGPGAIVEIVRSGDVIPKIIGVTKKVRAPMFPDEDFEWNSTNVDIVLKHPENHDGVKLKIIEHFFKTLGVPYFKRGTIKKTVEAGYDTIPTILRMKIKDFEDVEGISTKTAKKYRKVIRDHYNKMDIAMIMAASVHFGSGFAITKIKPIIELIPDILTTTMTGEDMVDNISSINGLSTKTGQKFVDGLSAFTEFYDSLP
jgi:DNA ligase (NAD+)